MKIGIRREDKSPLESRVPLVPEDVDRLIREESLEVVVESSPTRVFPDAHYAAVGATVSDALSDCPVIFGVKEIPLGRLEAGKTYVLFPHVIKGQPTNMPMLRRLMEFGCQVIDYEGITDDQGRRLVFFGRFAGLVGMIDTLWALGRRLKATGLRTPFSRLKQARDYTDLAEAKAAVAAVGEEIRTSGLPRELRPLICGFTGYGNVSAGAQEIYDLLPADHIAPEELAYAATRTGERGRNVYKVVFKEEHLVEPKNPDARFDLQDYYDHPERYRSRFFPNVRYLTLLANCVFWAPQYPRLVTKADVKALFGQETRPRLQVIGDITCDVDGSIECLVRATDPSDPVYVYDPVRDESINGVEGNGPVILAVDFLPAELPADASREFSRLLAPFVGPIARADCSVPFEQCSLPPEIKRATIVYQGELTEDYRHLAKHLE